MRKVMGFLILMVVGTFAMAAGDEAAASSAIQIPAAFSMALAAGLCALAMGRGIAAACEGMARNPGAAGAIRTNMIIGLALIESLAIYTLVVIFAV